MMLLEHADPDVYLSAFARYLGIRAPSKGVLFSLQRRPIGIHAVPRRIVLGITGGVPSVTHGESDKRLGRPDAWIFSEKWGVLVESKLGAEISEDQLHRHAHAARWPRGTYEIKIVTWQEIYTLFRHALIQQKKT